MVDNGHVTQIKPQQNRVHILCDTLLTHDLGTLSALLVLCEVRGNHLRSGFPSQMASNAWALCFFRLYPEQAGEEKVDLSMIWVAMTSL